jgi:5-methylthioadenosine/S-adenosylhomocysteine deaminase
MQSKQPVDLLIEARWVLPIAPLNAALSQHALAIADGRIVALGPSAALRARFDAREHIVRAEHVLLPGLVNAYTRAATVLERAHDGSAAPRSVGDSSPDYVRDGTELALGQMLRAGITCFGDDSSEPQEAARVAAAARMRAVIGLPITESKASERDGAIAQLAQAERLWDDYKSNPFVCLQFAPASAELGDATLTRVRTVADELDARIVVPVHESAAAVRAGLARHGCRPLRRLHELGLLRPGFTALHMAVLDDHDLELAARTGIAVVATVQAGLRAGTGAAPLGALLARGVSVGLGSGGEAQAGAFDLIAEARAAALHPSSAGAEAPALEPAVALELATLGGARALGLGSVIGSLEPGKAADVIAVDVAALSCQALATPAETLVFAATREHVADVWIAGRAVVTRGRLLAFDERELARLAQRWSESQPRPIAYVGAIP